MTTLTSPTYATPETQIYQSYKKQHDRKRRKSHNHGFIVSYPYVTNYMPSPFDPSGWTTRFGEIAAITGENPSGAPDYGLFEITENTGFARFSQSTPRFNALAGETIYAYALLKQASSGPVSTYWRVNTLAGGFLSGVVRNITAGDGDNYTYTDLPGGWVLVCYSFTLASDEDDIGCDLIIRDADGVTGTIGTDVYVQAAFFGKADDFPANVMPTL